MIVFKRCKRWNSIFQMVQPTLCPEILKYFEWYSLSDAQVNWYLIFDFFLFDRLQEVHEWEWERLPKITWIFSEHCSPRQFLSEISTIITSVINNINKFPPMLLDVFLLHIDSTDKIVVQIVWLSVYIQIISSSL